MTLESNEEYFFRLPAPTNAMQIVQDVRSQPTRRTNLQTNLSILDADGAVVNPSVIQFNEIDHGYRRTAVFSVKQPSRFGLRPVGMGCVF